jgi:phospholipid transport system substrate-binding protein
MRILGTLTPIRNDGVRLGRRAALGLGVAGVAAAVLPRGAFAALDNTQASALISQAVADVNAAIASGKTGPALYAQFEALFAGLDWRRVRAIEAKAPEAVE